MPGRADFCGVGTAFTSRKWLSLNPCGWVGISLSFGVHIFAAVVTVEHLIAGSFFSQAVFILLYLPLTLMAIWSLIMAWTTNPGAVPLGARPLVTFSRAASGEMSPTVQARKRGLRRCQKCNDNFKPNRAHHDSVTGRCIVKFDHYCPWVCNAVGAMNHKFFVLFVFYTMNTCISSIFMIIVRAIRCGYESDSNDSSSAGAADESFISSTTDNSTVDDSGEIQEEENAGDIGDTRGLFRGLQTMAPSSFIYEECEDFHSTYMVIVLLCVAVTFFIFTACMMVEQVEAIQTNQSKIARMKMRVGQGGTELSRVSEAFNEMFGGNSPDVAWHWFVPLPVKFPGSMHKFVMGFEWDPTFDPLPYREDNGNVEMSSTSSAASEATNGATQLTPVTVETPPDVESGVATTDLDEVSIDSSNNDEPSPIRKRSVASLPELA